MGNGIVYFKPDFHPLPALRRVMIGSAHALPLAVVSAKAKAAHLIAGVTVIIALVPLALR